MSYCDLQVGCSNLQQDEPDMDEKLCHSTVSNVRSLKRKENYLLENEPVLDSICSHYSHKAC